MSQKNVNENAANNRWQGSVVIVTGASRGIGRAVANAAAARGAKVGLVARSQIELAKVLEEIDNQGTIRVADICKPNEVAQAFISIEEQLGSIDILVHCAGIGAFGSFIETELDEFERLSRVNYLGTVYAMKAALSTMLKRGQGHIVNIASVAGRIGAPFEAAYSASKFAVVGLSESVAIEVERRGIMVSVVNPGPVTTDFFKTRGHSYPLKFPRPVSPEQVANAVINAVDYKRREQFVPKWFGPAFAARILMPSLYKLGIRKAYYDYLVECDSGEP